MPDVPRQHTQFSLLSESATTQDASPEPEARQSLSDDLSDLSDIGDAEGVLYDEIGSRAGQQPTRAGLSGCVRA